ncbi:unnamed protein product [Rotaria sordida]|uniref:Cadherin domain-containing protein n=1 Tax=Rotaria sordida TaxID=392033 RepID=A0A814WY63_9BILA|nr:unnamed protein product [Rotaria sordida]CAF1208406.1 unnamed protein product [Rotaria sordida]
MIELFHIVPNLSASQLNPTHVYKPPSNNQKYKFFPYKPAAIVSATFSEVLFLFNPTFLKFGALFYPDAHKSRQHPAVWTLFNTSCTQHEYEFDSAMILVDKRRVWNGLYLTKLIHDYYQVFYHHVTDGDKDTFRLIFRYMQIKYYLVMIPCSTGSFNNTHFCGLTLCKTDSLSQHIYVNLLTTLTKTYPTIDLKENIPINTNILELTNEIKDLKLVLLNLGGFETNLFTIKDQNLFTINEIDREKLIGEKKCFDRSYCLIELHILVNDGEQYWVIPIHIIDENDNKPEFRNSSIELKFRENIFGGYKILFEGAKDLDEGLNGKIDYILDCSKKKEKLIIKENKNKTLINCLPLFEFEIISKSLLLNQYDQLALKYNSLIKNEYIENEYNLILYAINYNLINNNELFNLMNINIKIEKILKKPKFDLFEYKFIIKIKSFLKNGTILGNVNAKSNDKKNKILYKLINKTNFIEINSLTGELFISNENFLLNNNYLNNNINLLIEGFYLNNKYLNCFTNVKIYFRLINYINNISYYFNIQSLFIKQLNNSNQFFIYKNISINEILFQINLFSFYYPFDKYILLLDDNYYSTFSLISSPLINNFILKISNYLSSKLIYLLNIRIKHELTQEWLSTNITIQFILIDQLTTISNFIQPSLPSSSSLTSSLTSSLLNICLENSTYFLYDFYNKNQIGKLKVIETNLNISIFSNYLILINKNEIVINQCRMLIDQFNLNYLNQTQYELCSFDYFCFNITLINQQQFSFFSIKNKNKNFILKSILSIRPIEITIFTFSLIFIMATITLILIICRLKGFHLCLSIKNYLFYGKKYGLNNAQRLSSTKMTQRVHSIVVRESRSPSFEHIESKPYIFNFNQVSDQDTIPSINIYSQSSPHLPISLSSTSSIQQEERTISNVDNEITPRTSSSSSFIHETKHLLDIMSINQDLHMSTLASEV